MNFPVAQPVPLPKIIGHRGLAGRAPENTLAAFRAASLMGLTWIEFDVMLSGDGNLVLIHDETVDRTTNGTGRVADLTVEQLKRLDAGSWFNPKFRRQRIPTIFEATEAVMSYDLSANIEVKPSKGFEGETGWALGRYLATEWPQNLIAPIISSFSAEALEAVAVEAPGFPRALLVERVPRTWKALTSRLGCSLIHCSQGHLRKKEAERIVETGMHLLCYTVNNARKAHTLWNWGVEAVFSDYPDRLLNI
ncbi:MAG: Glycerophosphoryl diester phosphodiesterase [Alphaproteobacteria bacterium MarineAlpha4_Bin2]|nr:MAG: Glycerophosphoryl diester phosphodiesterase [Alphaproteobacteria bacterium MarineAlpha4_Bin2]